jgi:hypothetical protein
VERIAGAFLFSAARNAETFFTKEMVKRVIRNIHGAFIRYPILVLTPRVAQRATVLGRRMQLKLAQIL